MASPLVLLKPGTVDDAPASPAAQAVQLSPPAPADGAEHLRQGPKHLGGGRPDGSWSTLEPDLADNMFHGSQMLTSSSKSFPGHVIREPPGRLMAPMLRSQLVLPMSQQGKRPWSYLGSSRRFPRHLTDEPGHPLRRKAQPVRS